MLEDLAVRRLGDLGLVADLLRMREELVAADMVEMEMRVDDDADILRFQAEQLQRAGDGLLGRLLRLLEGQHPHHMVVVVAGIDQEPALRMLDQDGIDGKADLPARAAIPVDVEAVENEGAVVEQVDLGVRHDRTSLAKLSGLGHQRAPRT